MVLLMERFVRGQFVASAHGEKWLNRVAELLKYRCREMR